MDNTQAETQQFFDMFNNLGQQRSAIEKEIQLMNSIQESFVSISTQKHKSDKFEVVIINHENESKQEQNPKIIPVSVHSSVQIQLWIHFWIRFMVEFVFCDFESKKYYFVVVCVTVGEFTEGSERCQDKCGSEADSARRGEARTDQEETGSDPPAAAVLHSAQQTQ